VAVLAANALLHLAVIAVYALVVQRGLAVRPQTYAWTLFETGACFIVYEAVFYALHRLLHAKLGPYHALHHETHANLGVTNFYMHPVDYALEVIVPLWTAISFVNPSLSVTLAVIVIGTINSVVSHSGVKVPGLPDPRDHWLHHHLATCNYGTGPLDYLYNTHRASSNVAFTCRQRV
jgi:sterol desaturase/sphingolipid hydroxylase (fatty acid hydroxylase superfamily)